MGHCEARHVHELVLVLVALAPSLSTLRRPPASSPPEPELGLAEALRVEDLKQDLGRG